MKKIIKIMSVFLITLLISINFINAVDLNLTENTNYNTNTSDVNESINDSTNSTYSNNSINNADTESIRTSTTVKTGNISDSSLNLSNVLNIFLIIVGILLILLAIAILIKLK